MKLLAGAWAPAGSASGRPAALAVERSATIARQRSTARDRSTVASAPPRIDVAQLYRRYGDMVYGRCLSLLRNEADAIDAVQEVFLKAHRYADRFEGRSKASTWLYRITTNHCLNVIRSRKRRPEDPVEDVAELVPLPVGDSVLDRVAGAQLVDRLLEGFDERTQQCVVYHYLDGMTHDEVGALLGISGAAVRKRLARFRRDCQARFPHWAGWASGSDK